MAANHSVGRTGKGGLEREDWKPELSLFVLDANLKTADGRDIDKNFKRLKSTGCRLQAVSDRRLPGRDL
jgi:hypothetical protein